MYENSEMTELADLPDFAVHNNFNLKAMSLFVLRRQNICAEPVHVNQGCRIKTSEASSISKEDVSSHLH